MIGSNYPNDAQDIVNPDQCPEYASMDRVMGMLERSAERMPFLLEEQIAGAGRVYTRFHRMVSRS